MLVENLPVPFDRRVWMESTTLRRAGYQVVVICPRGRDGARWHERLEEIDIYRYPLPSLSGVAGHIAEYAIALLATALLSLIVAWRHGFDVIHAANPPDLFFLIAALYKPFGKKFVFDHHDLVPEACETRWTGARLAVLRRLMMWCEHATFRMADLVISTNESYRRVALTRGGRHPDAVVVVRSGPLKSRFVPVPADPSLRGGRRFLVCYLGVMGPNDGVHLLLAAAHTLVTTFDFPEVRFVLIGSGDCFGDLVDEAHRRGLEPWVTFTGRISDELVIRYLSTADLGVAPDPRDALNDASTMNKIVEYMALEKPIVQYDLTEGRFSAQAASLYAKHNDPADFADKILQLLSDPAARAAMGRYGRERVERELSWEHEAPKLLAAYEALFSSRRSSDAGDGSPQGAKAKAS